MEQHPMFGSANAAYRPGRADRAYLVPLVGRGWVRPDEETDEAETADTTTDETDEATP